MSTDDFRIRKVPRGYKVWQRIGPGWEALSDVYSTRADARAAVEKFCDQPQSDLLLNAGKSRLMRGWRAGR